MGMEMCDVPMGQNYAVLFHHYMVCLKLFGDKSLKFTGFQ